MKKILLFLLIAFTSLLGVAQVNLTQGLAAHYPFNGNVNDQSGNGNHGTNNGAALTNDRNAVSNSAYNFNGTNSYISIPGTIITPSVAAVTICAWIKKDANWTNQSNAQIVYLGTDQGEMQLSLFGGTDANANARFAVAFSNDTWYGLDLQSPLTNNQYYFIVGKYVKGQNISLYVNNVLAGQVSVPNLDLVTNSATTSSIGSYNRAAGGYYFKGVIDDVRIYNRALTNQELMALYCPINTLSLTGVTTTNQAAETIVAPPATPSSQTNTINSGSNVLYRAKNSVTLNPGFKANSGAVFKAELGGCTTTNGLSANILSIAPQSVIDDLRLRGMNINEGNTPPALSGFFESKPHVLLSPYGPGDGYAVGTEFTSYRYRFYDQNVNAQTISLDKKSNDGTNTETGIGAFLAGNGNKFTLFAQTSGISDGITYRSLTVISGEITGTGIKDFQESFVFTEKGPDPTNKLIAVGQGRIIRDGDGLAAKVSSLRLSAENPMTVYVGKSMMSR